MLDQLIFYEAREEADPHRDLRMDVDNMSYEVKRIAFCFACCYINLSFFFIGFPFTVNRTCWLWENLLALSI
jgi:hypothetical protein